MENELPAIADCTCGLADRFLTTKQVMQICAISRSTLNRHIARGIFPQPIHKSPGGRGKRSVWSLREILLWMQAEKRRRDAIPEPQPKKKPGPKPGYRPKRPLTERTRWRHGSTSRAELEKRHPVELIEQPRIYGSRRVKMGY